MSTDPQLLKGKLANGLTYYIRENKKPEKKVELRLVIKAGSILEDEDQLGLAHMAEHMAFNGTKNFKKNEIVSYLQSIGVEFGNDLNAYTGFDETVYILPIPTDQPGNLEKGFQILEDWAHQVTYLDEDINNERGIILEESRVGKNGEERMFKQVYPELFKGSKYAKRLPIGNDSVIRNFKPDAIRRFYKDWYRTDLMSVIVVGDITQKEALAFIHKHFAHITPSTNPREREYATVPKYKENKAMVVTDKEATSISFSINYSSNYVQSNGSIGEYRKNLVRQLYTSMFYSRIRELRQKEKPPFVFAGIDFSSYAKFHENFSIYGEVGANQDVVVGINAVLEELERVKRYGFSDAELDREKKDVLSFFESYWNDRDKIESSDFVDKYINNFTDDEPILSIDEEFILLKKLLPQISTSEVNEVTNFFKNEINRFSYVTGPDTTLSFKLPSPDQIIALLDVKVNDTAIKPYEEKIVSTELLTYNPKAGKVTKRKRNEILGTTEIVLSNGVKVTLKETDFKNDQILFSAFRYGGLTNYGVEDKYSAENAVAVVTSMGVGSFSPTDLTKSLAGKLVNIEPYISNYSSGFSGNSSKKDIEILFKLLNLYASEPRRDTSLFKSVIQRGKARVSMLASNPEVAFIDTLSKVMYSNNPLAPTTVPSAENYDKINLERAIAIYKERVGDFGGMHITIVGNINEIEVLSLLEKYVAGLPSSGRSVFVDNNVSLFNGENRFEYKKGKEDKSLILSITHGEVPYRESTALMLYGLSDALNIIITEEMREKIQGIYGGETYVEFSKIPKGQYQLVLELPCGPAKVDTLIATYMRELNKIATKGIDPSYVEKVKKAWLEKYRVDAKTNEFWLSELQALRRGITTIDRIINAEKYYNAFSHLEVKKAALLLQKAKGKLVAIHLPE